MASFTLHGIPVSRGIAIGRAHLLRPAARDVKHYLISEDKVKLFDLHEVFYKIAR